MCAIRQRRWRLRIAEVDRQSFEIEICIQKSYMYCWRTIARFGTFYVRCSVSTFYLVGGQHDEGRRFSRVELNLVRTNTGFSSSRSAVRVLTSGPSHLSPVDSPNRTEEEERLGLSVEASAALLKGAYIHVGDLRNDSGPCSPSTY